MSQLVELKKLLLRFNIKLSIFGWGLKIIDVILGVIGYVDRVPVIYGSQVFKAWISNSLIT